jgi:predicted short-subunit dehydrogenase-like oxidoreductase (DUF2520 family)
MEAAFSIVGAGAAARVLAGELAQAGAGLALWARKPRAARELAAELVAARAARETEAPTAELPALRAHEGLTGATAGSECVLLCVSDAALAEVAALLAEVEPTPRVVLHVSGYHDSSALASLAARGASVGSLHPVRPLPADGGRPGCLAGADLAFEGMPAARERALAIAEACGAELFDLPARAGAKHAYHAAAALLSNGTVALFDAALELAGGDEKVERAFLGLLEGTLENLRRLGVPDALTGPALRGDAEVLEGHLEQLDSDQHALYGPLTARMLELAHRRGALTSEQVERLRQIL